MSFWEGGELAGCPAVLLVDTSLVSCLLDRLVGW